MRQVERVEVESYVIRLQFEIEREGMDNIFWTVFFKCVVSTHIF